MPSCIRTKNCCLRILFSTICCGFSLFQLDGVIAQDVQQATHVAPVQSTRSPFVRFQQQAARVGDRVTQQVAMDLQLQGSIIQSGQVAGQQDASMKRGQKREVEVLEVVDGQVRKARVTFPHSRELLAESKDGQETIQPVEGKSYMLTREGERLLVMYTDGTIPPADEFEIVINSMQSLGRPNPIAEFLMNRDFQIGQKVEVPLVVAQEMLGFGSELGEVTRFELTLSEVKDFEGDRCAVFDSHIQVGGQPRSPVSMQAKGPVVIRLDTCRTVLADFSGPLQMSAIHTTPQSSYQQQVEGSMRVAIRSNYLN